MHTSLKFTALSLGLMFAASALAAPSIRARKSGQKWGQAQTVKM